MSGKKRRYRYTFAESEESSGGKMAARLALASAALLAASSLISLASGGQAGSFIGALGLMALLFAAYGFYVGMKSFGERGVLPTWSIIGSIVSGVLMVIWLTIFLSGLG